MRRALLVAVTATASLSGCNRVEGQAPPEGKPPADALNERVLPNSSRRLVSPATDPAATVRVGDDSQSVVSAGETWTIRVWLAPAGADLGVRFGDAGVIHVFSATSAAALGDGSSRFQFSVPDTVCYGLPTGEPNPTETGNWSWEAVRSPLCHDLAAQLYAVTTADKVSEPAEQKVVLACNNCTEASCRTLLSKCRSGCLDGEWLGQWQIGDDQSGRVHLGLFQEQGGAFGELRVDDGPSCVAMGRAEASLEGNDVTIEQRPFGEQGGEATWRGTVDRCLAIRDGTFAGTCDGGQAISGTFSAAKVTECEQYCQDLWCHSDTHSCGSPEDCRTHCEAECPKTRAEAGLPGMRSEFCTNSNCECSTGADTEPCMSHDECRNRLGPEYSCVDRRCEHAGT